MKTKLLIVFALTSCICFSQTGLDFTSSSPATFVKGLDNASLDLTQGTIEAWIKTADAGTTYRGILVKQAAYGMFLYDNELIAYDWGSNTEKESNVILNDDQWHHVAITFDDNVTNGSQFYVDGQPVLSFTYNVQTSNTLIVVGKGNDTEADIGQQFNGQIDNVRVWNTIRTNTEILGTFNKCLTGNENGLVLNWKFEEGSGTSTADDSGNGNTGTLYNMDNTNWVSGYSCYPIELVAYYPFNGNANDESGNENHGTVNGATLTTDRFGNTDNAYSFDGTSQYISIPNNSNINIADGESYSISFWLKHNAQNNAKYLISKYKGSFGEPSYAFGTGSNGDSYSWHEFTASNGTESRGDIDLNNNEWHHVTSVFKSGESVAIYVDGILDVLHPTTHTGSITNTRDLTIGCGSNLAQYYNGSIDDIKIYKKALTIEEINNEAMDLVAYYPFNENANDESGNENHGTVNGATLTTDRFGDTDSAYNFDGNDQITIAHNDILNSSDELSFSVWVKPNLQQNAMILGKSNYTSATNYLLRTKSTGFIQFEYKNFADSNSIPLVVNNWNHIAVVSNTDNSKMIYINGVLATHTSSSSPYGIVPNILTIGYASYGSEYFNGGIDDLRIYKSALSESDILSLYTNNALNIEKLTETTERNFYISNNTLHFKITQNLNEIKSIEVYNLLGQKVFKTSKIEEEIKLENLREGIYIAKVYSENGYQTLKFINK